MKTKPILLVVAAVGVGIALWAWRSEAPSSEASRAAVASGPLVAALPQYGAEQPRGCDFDRSWKASYDYDARVDSSLSVPGMGEPVSGLNVFTGKLAFEAVEKTAAQEWVLLGQFSKVNKEVLSAHGKELEAPFLIKVGARCEVRSYARLKSIKKTVGQVQQAAMHDLWVYQLPTDGSQNIRFENGTGVANAVMTRLGVELTRSLKEYEMSWRLKNPMKVTESSARAVIGKNWFESFESREGISGGMVNSAVLTLRVTKEPASTASIDASASHSVSDYAWENLLSGDFSETTADVTAVPQAERRFVEQMKNETIETSFASLAQKVYDKENVESQWHKMAGFLNGHPDKIQEFAKGLGEPDFPEAVKGVSFLVLSKTTQPEARNALMGILRDTTRSSGDRVRASLALVTRKDVGPELASTLRQDALESSASPDDTYGRNAVMHLGILASTHRSDAEVQEVARATILEMLSSAGNDTHRLAPALGAVGNLADVDLLSKVEALTHHPDPEVRALIPRSLRGYPYAQTEKLVLNWLTMETSPDVTQGIFDIVYHQLAEAQRAAGEEMVNEAVRHLAMQPSVFSRQSIVHILGPVKDQFPKAKEILISQLAEEFRNKSGIYSQIAQNLSPEEVALGLSRMPEFAHQFGVPGEPRAVLDLDQKDAHRARGAQ